MAKYNKRLSYLSGIWRINGFNNLDLNHSKYPQIYVSLSQIREEGLGNPLSYGVETGENRFIKQPLNRISDFLIGSCWKDGKRINKLPPLSKTFTVDTSQIKILALDEKFKLNNIEIDSILPYSALKLGSHCGALQNTLYVWVPVINDSRTKFLVISCVELYRFYVGVSSRFSNSVIQNAHQKYMEWNNPSLKINQSLSRLENFVAYRGHCSAEGRRWFNTPNNHLKETATINNSRSGNYLPLMLKAIFPFSGKTTLTIAGKNFNLGTRENPCWGVHAANIIKCGRPIDFQPKITFDTSSNTPSKWSSGVDDDPVDDNDDFEGENDSDENEEKKTGGRRIGILNPSNQFEAMNGLKFDYEPTGDTKNPVYNDPYGEYLQGNGGSDDTLYDPDTEGNSSESKFDSHIDTVDRKLSDFIKMIKHLRDNVQKHKWTVNSRSCRATLNVEGEVVTTFLHSKKRKKSWSLMPPENTRLRQIAWIEIALDKNSYIYLAEMELKETEKGRSTLCIMTKNLSYMPENDFESFLRITAIQNRWPKETHKWKTYAAKYKADEYFKHYQHIHITHGTARKDESHEDYLKFWAKNIEEKILTLLGEE
ncbi:hypothetical protein [Vibrio algivorus]|uniref:Uncharacterized protein n=2 Tax=Vibrio algivorus TaxID=1667024 RepID=A0A557NSR3_9VIBR|nr:hypothetical protein [Vibrio algivorus]TVO31345.1 hypothetical protein FOF44_18050 [Vibrio algivorus]